MVVLPMRPSLQFDLLDRGSGWLGVQSLERGESVLAHSIACTPILLDSPERGGSFDPEGCVHR
jgi:hypothetical protein